MAVDPSRILDCRYKDALVQVDGEGNAYLDLDARGLRMLWIQTVHGELGTTGVMFFSLREKRRLKSPTMKSLAYYVHAPTKDLADGLITAPTLCGNCFWLL